MYKVTYYKRLDSGWRKGQIRNLTLTEAIKYVGILCILLDTAFVKIVRPENEVL